MIFIKHSIVIFLKRGIFFTKLINGGLQVGNLMSRSGISFHQLVDFCAQYCMRKRFHFFLHVFKKVGFFLKFIYKSLEKSFHSVPHGGNPPSVSSQSNMEHIFCSVQLIFHFWILCLQGSIFMRKGFHLLHEIIDMISFIAKIIHHILKNGFHCLF
jgi:hypothetical protein